MSDVARPMLAEVLAALTDSETYAWSCGRRDLMRLAENGVTWELLNTEPRFCDRIPWLHADPGDAQEALVARGLLPDSWCEDVRRGWYFGDTFRTGTAPDSPLWYGMRPRTISDLVTVASLGQPAIQRAEELARQAVRGFAEYECPQPDRVVWRVGGRGNYWHKVRGCGDAMVTLEGVVYNERSKPKSAPVAALWDMGFALDAITDDAVRIVVPPVGGVR